MSDVTDKNRFDEAISVIAGRQHENHGIGTLGEKSVHAVTKIYMEPDEDYHEVPIDGYVADIFKDNKVIEIQTGSFQALRPKLATFLPRYQVEIVHPIPAKRLLCYIDPDTGEVVSKRRSNKTGTPQMIFRELYKIRDFITDPHLSVTILMIDVEDIRLLDGYGKYKKNHATKYDRFPLKLTEHLHLETPKDYTMLIPIELETFTSKDYAKAVKIPRSHASNALQILNELNVVKRVGKQGNSYLYEVNE